MSFNRVCMCLRLTKLLRAVGCRVFLRVWLLILVLVLIRCLDLLSTAAVYGQCLSAFG